MVSFDYLLFMVLIVFLYYYCIYAEEEASPALAK
jgi:hypothetical protein